MSEFKDLLNLQHGVLSRQQALRHGITYGAVKARVAKGIWQRVHYGVYATFSGELTRQSLLWAGVLRAGAGAVLSHETAAELNGLTDRTSEPIHVAIPRERRVTRVPGVAVHVSARAEESRHPVLLPPRTRVEDTALDLVEAATSLDEALSWLARSCGRRLTTAQRLLDAMRGRTRMRWRRELQYALSDVGSGAHSVLELRYVRDVERAHDLPRGTRQAPAARGSRKQWNDVDYPQQGTIVELDGRRGHSDEGAWRDMHRDNHSLVEGRVVLRYGWADVALRPCAVALQIGSVLRRRGWKGQPRPCGPGCVIGKNIGTYGDLFPS